ncbi:hypothetical protein ACFQU2_08795 [Siccirubricoccus deserti]
MDRPAALPPALPDPRGFDPVCFPGAARLGEWPPPRFDFAAAVLREPGLRFERDAAGSIAVVRRFDHIRLVTDIDRAHLLFDILPGSRDFMLLRLVPAALRFMETVSPQDPMPARCATRTRRCRRSTTSTPPPPRWWKRCRPPRRRMRWRSATPSAGCRPVPRCSSRRWRAASPRTCCRWNASPRSPAGCSAWPMPMPGRWPPPQPSRNTAPWKAWCI